MDDFCDRTDANARKAADLADAGQNLPALYKMQDDIREARTPLQAIQYASEVKGMLAVRNSQAHVNMIENVRTGAVDVMLEIPALSADGRQYVDQMGRPMLIKEEVAHIETRPTVPDRIVVLPPRIDCAPPPCYEERAWLRLDERRGHVRFDLNLGGVRIDVGVGDHHRGGPPPFDPHRWYPGRDHDRDRDRGRGGWNNDLHYGDGRNQPRRENTPVIENKIENKITIINKNENTNNNSNNNSRPERTERTERPSTNSGRHEERRPDTSRDKHDDKKKR